MHFQKHFLNALCLFFATCVYNARCTEVSVSSYQIYTYLGIEINLPVLVCHPKHTEYKEVIWKKDNITLKIGSTDLPSHVLSLLSLLEFESPFKLQGYYWCETDVSNLAYVHDYLFKIEGINTYVGRLVAKNDSLGEVKDSTNYRGKDQLSWKMELYEEEMQSVLFESLPYTNVSVTNIKELEEGGLEVRFYLYVRNPLHPRRRTDSELVKDQDHLLDILDFLKNETSSQDARIYNIVGTWTDLLGINIMEIDLRSTLGCYKEEYEYSLPSNTTEIVTWPDAKIGDVVIPENACLSMNDLAITRMCTGSFTIGAKWGIPSGECQKPANDITLQLKDLYDNYGKYTSATKIEKLNVLTMFPSDLGVSDLHIVADILKKLSRTSKLDQQEISGILSVTDKILEANKTELVAAKHIIRLTSRILRIFHNILEQASREEKEIRISKRHLMVDTKYTHTIDDENPVLGLAVVAPNLQDSLYNGSVEFLLSSTKLPKQDSIAHFSLPRDLVLKRESQLEFPCQVNMVFFKEWDLFQNPKEVLPKRNYRVLPTPVMYVSISGGPAWNLTDPVHVYFKDTFDEEIENPVCVYYDSRLEDGAGAWSSEGCEYEGRKQGYYHCRCHHLSIFAIILSQSPYLDDQSLNLGISVYVGCGISILALSLSVLLYILSKHWRQTIDHSLLFSLSLTFLACLIIIFASETHFKRRSTCMLLALILQYTILAIFGWLLVQAVVYRLRFAKKTDVSEIPHFMIKASISVWGAPIIIVIIIWLTKDFTCSSKEGCLSTVYEVAKVSTIPVILLINVTLCINLCATYALTCRYRKDFLIGDTGYNDVAMKFRVAFTIFFFFVLSWIFGILTLHTRSKTLRILFSISVTLTAYYITLFFIFQEISFWDLCSCCKQKKEIDTPAIQYQGKQLQSIDDSNKAEK